MSILTAIVVKVEIVVKEKTSCLKEVFYIFLSHLAS